MSYLARGPVGTTGIDSKAHGSSEPTPGCCAYHYSAGGEGMTYLTRCPSSLGIGSKRHPSKEPTPFCALLVDAKGGDGMSHRLSIHTATHDFPTTPQAAP
jgi:hypothetical protein